MSADHPLELWHCRTHGCGCHQGPRNCDSDECGDGVLYRLDPGSVPQISPPAPPAPAGNASALASPGAGGDTVTVDVDGHQLIEVLEARLLDEIKRSARLETALAAAARRSGEGRQ